MKNKIPIIVFLGLLLLYYWKVFIKGYVPFPGDLLVGAYYPWLENKWGYIVGVPIKNPLISDVFSQFYIWKTLIADSFTKLQFPLWNPYSYFGYPLLANFHSGALNPFNFLIIFFGRINGWNAMIIAQTAGSLLAMYWYLTNRKLGFIAALTGAVTYAFSGFAIAWSQFVTAGFAMIWIPLILLAIDLYFTKKKFRYLLFISPFIFLLVTAGHFQSLIYGLVFVCFYFGWSSFQQRERFGIEMKRDFFAFLFVAILGAGLSAIQLIPTLEYLKYSIRFDENYIGQFNNGLLPIGHFITFFIPDFFGNTVTGNYWGFFNYHETIVYAGLLSLFALTNTVIDYKKLHFDKIFVFGMFFVLLFLFDSPISQFIYKHNFPIISTSVAGRLVIIYVLCVSVITALWVQSLGSKNLAAIVKRNIFVPSAIIVAILVILAVRQWYVINELDEAIKLVNISFRNSLYPLTISFGVLGAILLINRHRVFGALIIIILLADLFRFGWKYTPFVDHQMVFPVTDSIEYLMNQDGVYRIEREKAPIIPPNTWAYYKLMSPSGYDPMAPLSSVKYHQININKEKGDTAPPRYSEASMVDAYALGEVNVKYFASIRKNEEDDYALYGENTTYNVNMSDWILVHESPSIFIFENIHFKPRAYFLNSTGNMDGEISIVSYTPSKIEINYSIKDDSHIIITDTWMPGWKAEVDNIEIPVEKYNDTFRKLNVPTGTGKIVMFYQPFSFRAGLLISGLSLLGWFSLYYFLKPREKKKRPVK